MVERYKYKCIDAYEEPENPMEWLPCPRCGLRPLVWEFDNGRVTAWGCCLLGKFAKYHKYPHPFYDDGVVKLYMPIPPISLALEGDRGILNIGEFKGKEIDYEQK